VKPDVFQSNALCFKLLNEGWGPALGLKACFHLTPTDAANTAKARHGDAYPHQVVIGDFDETINVNISSALIRERTARARSFPHASSCAGCPALGHSRDKKPEAD
jgi:hypothetical protein